MHRRVASDPSVVMLPIADWPVGTDRAAAAAPSALGLRGPKIVRSFDLAPHTTLRVPFIVRGYRTDHGLVDCLRSLFRLHNETANVWTHLFGCGVFIALTIQTASAAYDEDWSGVKSSSEEEWSMAPHISARLHGAEGVER